MNWLGFGLWLATWKAKAIVAASIIATLSVVWFGWLAHHDSKVEAKVVQRSVEAGRKANEKNDHVRRAAERPGAFERLRKSACSDCN